MQLSCYQFPVSHTSLQALYYLTATGYRGLVLNKHPWKFYTRESDIRKRLFLLNPDK